MHRAPDYFRSLVQAAPVPMFTLAVEDGALTSTNPAFDELTGHDAREGPSSLNAYVHPGDVAVFISNLHQAMLGRPPSPFEIRLATSSGTYQISELTMLPEVRDGKLAQILGFVKDLSERRSIVRDLRAARDAAEAGSRAKTEFLANMSHEIRTPLNAVVALSGLLTDMSLAPQAHSFAQIIENSSQTLLGLINSVLDFSKIESDKLELENQPFAIDECVRSAVDLVSSQASEKGLVIDTEIATECPSAVYGDITRVRQVLANLLSNAVKFTEEGSVQVKVGCRPTEPSGIHALRATEDAKVEIVFEVRDTGIGIPPDKQARIFDVFSQADASTTRRFGGTGLGLTISRRLTELMGGDIGVDSEPGRGSTFHFSIRCRPARLSQAPEAPDRVDPELARKLPLRILVAEDHPTNQLVARLLLEKMGYEPDVVEDGRQAVEAVARSGYDVVLMDVHMPVLDGLAATREIHRLQDDQIPKIVAVTASMLKGDRERCLAAGVDEFLGKPIFADELEAMLKLVSGYREATDLEAPETDADDPERDADEELDVRRLEVVQDSMARDLLRLGGTRPQELVHSYLHSARDSIVTLETALQDGDVETLGKAGHRMKGASGVFGAQRVEAICAALERRGRTGRLDGAEEELVALRREFEAVEKELTRMLG